MVQKKFLSYWAGGIHGDSQFFLHLLPIVYLLRGISHMEMSEVLGNQTFSKEKRARHTPGFTFEKQMNHVIIGLVYAKSTVLVQSYTSTLLHWEN